MKVPKEILKPTDDNSPMTHDNNAGIHCDDMKGNRTNPYANRRPTQIHWEDRGNFKEQRYINFDTPLKLFQSRA